MKICNCPEKQKDCKLFDINRQNPNKCLHLRFNEYCLCCEEDDSYKTCIFKEKNEGEAE